MHRLRLAVLAFALCATRLYGRVEFVLMHNGQPLKGGEVCFARTGLPASDTHPSQYWFDNNDVRCLSADLMLDLPAGRFHYFARHDDGFVTIFKSSFVGSAPTTPEAYNRNEQTMFPAMRVDLRPLRQALGADEWLAFATADSETEVGTILPVPDDAVDVMLPLDWPILPLVIRNRMPVRIGSVITLRRGDEPRIQFGPKAGTGDILTWIDVDWSTMGSVSQRDLERLAAPSVSLATSNRTLDPVLTTRHARSAFATLQVFKDVPHGKAIIQLGGRTWEADEVPVDVVRDSLTIASRPLRGKLAAALRVEYAVVGSAVSLSSVGSRGCDAKSPEEEKVAFKLYRCRQPVSEPIDVERCVPAGATETILSSPSAEFVGVPAGNYVIEAGHPGIGVARQAQFLGPGSDTDARLEVNTYPVFGSVTQGGKPLRAQLVFLGGSKFEKQTATDDAGYFEAILRVEPKNAAVDIKACAGTLEYTYIPESPILANQRVDITIPGGSIQATVVDSSTKRALPKAVIGLVQGASTPQMVMRRAVADENGTAEILGIAQGEVKVCARYAEYHQRCKDFVLREGEAKSVLLELSSESVVRGRLEPAADYDIAFLYWVDRFGRLTERVRVESDGTFGCAITHSPDEYVVLSSTRLPLFLIDQWGKSDGDLIVRVPLGAPARSFFVNMPPDDPFRSRYVAISIGERLVPPDAFDLHLMNRGTDPLVKRGSPLHVKEIGATGPLTVILGPSPEEIPPGPVPANLFIEPSFTSLLRRQRLADGADSVRF